MNREHAYLRAVFNELSSLGFWKKENPLAKLRQFKIQERELSFLSLEQIPTLIEALSQSNNRHALMISKVCLATGARWGEAEILKTSQLRNEVIQFAKTKSGKVRSVPISEELNRELLAHHNAKDTGERLFASAYSAFREAIDRTELTLPDGQLTHVLRHTFASHFMMRGGNILTLNKILGHASLTMTMRYAHLAPEHLQDAIKLNPLAPATTSKRLDGAPTKRKKELLR
jgi:integrase